MKGQKGLLANNNVYFNKKMIILGMLPGLILYIVFFVLPSLGTFVFSFTDITQIPGQEWKFIGLDNYREVLFKSNSRDFIASLKNTFTFSLFTTIIQTVLSLVIAIVLNKKHVRGKNLYRTVIFLPTILGVTVTSLCFKLFFSIDGPAQGFLQLFDTSSTFFADPKIGLLLIIFCQVWMSTGYEMVIFIAGLQNIPENLYEAANIDGANGWQAFIHVTLPQLWSTVIVNLLLCLVGSLSAFQIILLTTGGTPATRTLAMFVYQIAFGIGQNNNPNAGRQGLAAAMQMILFVMILVVTLSSNYLMNKVNKGDD